MDSMRPRKLKTRSFRSQGVGTRGVVFGLCSGRACATRWWAAGASASWRGTKSSDAGRTIRKDAYDLRARHLVLVFADWKARLVDR